MFCNDCGAELLDGSKFCNVCGAKLIVPQTGQQEIPPIQPSYDYGVQQPVQPSYEQAYQQPSYEQTAPQGTQPNYEKQPQPVNERKVKPAKAPKKKLPAWAKILIAVCVITLVGVAIFLTIHIIKGKKGGKASVTINGVKCEFNDKEGMSNLDKVNDDGVVYRYISNMQEVCNLYKNGEFIDNVYLDDYNIAVEKGTLSYGDKNHATISSIKIGLYNNINYKFSDGAGSKSTPEELKKYGYIFNGKIPGGYCYSKLYDKNGEISISSIESDYDKVLENGFDSLEYSIGPGFGEQYYFAKELSGDKQENKQALIDATNDSLLIDDYDSYFKFKIMYSREIGKLTGMKKDVYESSTNDYLVRVDIYMFDDGDCRTDILIFAPSEKLNEYMSGWGLPDNIFRVSDAKITTEHYDTKEDATIEIYSPYIEIRPGADIPTEEEETTQQPVEPWEISVSDIPEYDALEEFFLYYDNDGFSSEYDNQSVSDYYNVLCNILSHPSCINYNRYNTCDFEEPYGGASDPRGYINNEWSGADYISLSVDGLKWVALNIFNVSETDFTALSDKLLEDDMYYLENNRYYHAIYGAGSYPMVFTVYSVKTDGVYYYITYSVDRDPEMFGGYGDDSLKYEAKMELKNIDGINYWTMYYDYAEE
ncbi:MAG: zinc-ribbon domain-containing protein [Lachnospiraceae bacterium]|nr:zinc-ribbon domain-containing protein [Lachnospiraceae bacterium]